MLYCLVLVWIYAYEFLFSCLGVVFGLMVWDVSLIDCGVIVNDCADVVFA